MRGCREPVVGIGAAHCVLVAGESGPTRGNIAATGTRAIQTHPESVYLPVRQVETETHGPSGHFGKVSRLLPGYRRQSRICRNGHTVFAGEQSYHPIRIKLRV